MGGWEERGTKRKQSLQCSSSLPLLPYEQSHQGGRRPPRPQNHSTPLSTYCALGNEKHRSSFREGYLSERRKGEHNETDEANFSPSSSSFLPSTSQVGGAKLGDRPNAQDRVLWEGRIGGKRGTATVLHLPKRRGERYLFLPPPLHLGWGRKGEEEEDATSTSSSPTAPLPGKKEDRGARLATRLASVAGPLFARTKEAREGRRGSFSLSIPRPVTASKDRGDAERCT